MGMTSAVVGFRLADEKWKKMKAIWLGCKEAGIRPPKEVEDYFGGEDPGNKLGMQVDIKCSVAKFCAEDAEGFDVDVSKLPADVRLIRFYNSW